MGSDRAARRAKPRASPARAAAARANGSRGGRPRARLPDDVLALIGPMPTTGVLERAHWANKVLLTALDLSIRGALDKELAATIRAFAGTISRTIPLDVAAELERRLRADAEQVAEDTTGPQVEEVPHAAVEAIRGTAR
jgi:hypothetical protein